MKFSALSVIALAAGANAASHESGPDKSMFQPADGVLAGNYPATFPTENDNYVGVEQLPGFNNIKDGITLPSLKEGETFPKDKGGQSAAALEYCNPFSILPYGIFLGGTPEIHGECGRPFERMFYVFFGNFYHDIAPINCTAGDIRIEGPLAGGFSGHDKVCETGSCCPHLMGQLHITQEWNSQQKKWDERYVKYGCTWLTHDAYCFIIMYNLNWCIEYFQYPHEQGMTQVRTVIWPCPNLFDYFLSQCTAFKALGAKTLLISLNIEPEDYATEISAAESNTALAVFYMNDRICKPLIEVDAAMFAKETADEPAAEPSSSGGSSTPAPSGSSSSSSSSSDKDASAVVKAPVAVFSAILAMFAFARFF